MQAPIVSVDCPLWAEPSEDLIDLVHKAKRCDTETMLRLLLCFEPLRRKWERAISYWLPHENADVLAAEARFQFLLLVLQYEPERTVPFLAYIREMFPQRMRNWAQKECRHQCRQACSNAFQLPQRLGQAGEDDPASSEFHLQHEAESEAVTLHLWWEQELSTLPPQQRKVIRLVLQGLTEREIACQLGISHPRVHQLKSCAQKKLQEDW